MSEDLQTFEDDAYDAYWPEPDPIPWPEKRRQLIDDLSQSLPPDWLAAAEQGAIELAGYSIKHAELSYQLNYQLPKDHTARIQELKLFIDKLPTETTEQKLKWCQLLMAWTEEVVLREAHWPWPQRQYKILRTQELIRPRMQEMMRMDYQRKPHDRGRTMRRDNPPFQQISPIKRPSEPFRTTPVDLQGCVRSETGALGLEILDKLFMSKHSAIGDSLCFAVTSVSRPQDEGTIFYVQWEGMEEIATMNETELKQLLQDSLEVQPC